MYKNILVPVDLSKPLMTKKLCQAASAAASCNDAKITLLTVVPGFSMPIVASYFPDDAMEKVHAEYTALLTQVAEDNFSQDVDISVRAGKRGQAILDKIDEGQYDLALIGTRKKHSRGGAQLLGSCSSAVADRANCTVLVVR